MLSRLGVARARAAAWTSRLACASSSIASPSLDSASVGELRAELDAAHRAKGALERELASMADPTRKTVLMLGAGRSATALISYLVTHAEHGGWRVKLGDASGAEAMRKVGASKFAHGFELDGGNDAQLGAEVAQADLVISLLPVTHHERVLKHCLAHRRPMLTASYASKELMRYDAEARARGVLVMMECGVDPGIDHMTAMRMLDHIRAAGGTIDSFASYTGGLIADECDTNPWKYKFTWNPRNVVLAGNGMSEFAQRGSKKYVPYHRVFERIERIAIPATGAEYEGYANRNSLQYISVYGLDSCPSVLRGTLRKRGFCAAWNVFVQLGVTDDSYVIEDTAGLTYAQFLDFFLPHRRGDSVELKLCYVTGLPLHAPEVDKLRWLGMFSDRRIGLKRGTPAQILEHILSRKWALAPGDRDLIAMVHKVKYTTAAGEKREMVGSLTALGEGAQAPEMTAMAKTVGLPVAIAAKLILQGKIGGAGVTIPVKPELYTPILAELETLGITMVESDSPIAAPATR